MRMLHFRDSLLKCILQSKDRQTHLFIDVFNRITESKLGKAAIVLVDRNVWKSVSSFKALTLWVGTGGAFKFQNADSINQTWADPRHTQWKASWTLGFAVLPNTTPENNGKQIIACSVIHAWGSEVQVVTCVCLASSPPCQKNYEYCFSLFFLDSSWYTSGPGFIL